MFFLLFFMDIVPILKHPPTQIWIYPYFVFFIEPFPKWLFLAFAITAENTYSFALWYSFVKVNFFSSSQLYEKGGYLGDKLFSNNNSLPLQSNFLIPLLWCKINLFPLRFVSGQPVKFNILTSNPREQLSSEQAPSSSLPWTVHLTPSTSNALDPSEPLQASSPSYFTSFR